MRVAVIGAGYVGLTTAACLAELGHNVACADIDDGRVAALSSGRVDVLEPGLEDMVRRMLAAGRLRFTTDPAEAAGGVEIAIIAVGTPPDAEGGTDLTSLHEAARNIAPALGDQAIVVVKSTAPVGTGDGVEAIVERPVVANPEFLREGSAVADFMEPARIVVGADDQQAGAAVAALYRPLTDGGVRLLTMSRRSAELAKYAANALLATKVTFANEIADLAEALGADAPAALNAAGLDPRIGPAFLRPGPGVGGSCFPKDTESLAAQGRSSGAPALLIEAVVAANAARRERMLKRVIAVLGGDPQGKTVAILGLAFKANTDDVRESAAFPLIAGLLAAGAAVRAFDPRAMERARLLLGDALPAADPYDAAKGAHALVIITEWPMFAELDLVRLREGMAQPVIVDLRNLMDSQVARRAGFHYYGIGRGGLPD